MSTQIILTAPVDNLGAEGDTITVADGYARNFLFPKGLAMPAKSETSLIQAGLPCSVRSESNLGSSWKPPKARWRS